MKVERLKIVFLVFSTMLLVQCSQNEAPNTPLDTLIPAADEAYKVKTLGVPITPNPVNSMDHTPMIPSVTPPSASGIQILVEKAKADLAKRLSVSIIQISLVEAREVVWPNASLGCPQKGMAYAEVLTPGYIIVLNAVGKEYRYHASKGTEVIYCENPTPPIPGTSDDR